MFFYDCVIVTIVKSSLVYDDVNVFSIMGRWPELDGINLYCIVFYGIV